MRKKINSRIFLMLVAVIGAIVFSGVVSAESPTLKLSVSNYDPLPAVPGRNVELWVSIQNTGTAEAQNLEIEFVDSSVFKLLSDNDRFEKINVLGAQKDYVMKYTVNVADSAPDGSNELLLRYSIGNVPGSVYESKIYIDVKSTEVPVTISSVQMDPSTLSPGSKATLTLSIKNLAKSSNIRDMTVDLQVTPVVSASSILIDLPFVPIGSASQKTVESIKSGQTAKVVFELAAYPDAVSRIYKIPVSLSFKDDSGVEYNKTVLVGVEVNSKPDVLVNIESSDIKKSKLSGELNFEITNKGLGDVKLMTFVLGESEDYDILSPSSEIYIGNIDSDDFETARFSISAKNQDSLKIPVTIEYKDSLNNNFEQSFELQYVIRNGEKGNGSGMIVVVIIIILIVAAIIFFRARSKKKRANR